MDDLKQFLMDMFDYYNRKPSEGALKTYIAALKGMDIGELSNIYLKHISDPDTGQFIPKVADFVRASQGTKKGNAIQAWNKVYNAIIEIGPYITFSIDDPWAMKALDELGGFARLCEMSEKDLEFKMNEFCKLYESLRSQGTPDRFPAKVKGFIELENGKSEDVVLIGNAERAKRVLEGGSNRRLEVTKLSEMEVKRLN